MKSLLTSHFVRSLGELQLNESVVGQPSGSVKVPLTVTFDRFVKVTASELHPVVNDDTRMELTAEDELSW